MKVVVQFVASNGGRTVVGEEGDGVEKMHISGLRQELVNQFDNWALGFELGDLIERMMDLPNEKRMVEISVKEM